MTTPPPLTPEELAAIPFCYAMHVLAEQARGEQTETIPSTSLSETTANPTTATR